MKAEYSPKTVQHLRDAFDAAQLARPMRVARYEVGQEVSYDVTGVWPARAGKVHLRIERFVGGGFAGQVYRVEVLAVDSADGTIGPLAPGLRCAMKILIPPSRLGQRFRDALYAVGFQSAFSLQVNPTAARAGALWQTFIRRAARERLGGEQAVTEIIATFVDERLGSCGELSEWIDGRSWRLEVNDRLDYLKCWRQAKLPDPRQAGSDEYRAKWTFMAALVGLMHEMGAPELARQYTWSTCKSQPNVLKRDGFDDDPAGGLTAVDFRAGLALLGVLPMSPGDVGLIVRGLRRGSLVQFDRGNVATLRRFIDERPELFSDMQDACEELAAAESAYRDSMLDVTHHHVRLLYSRRLWAGVCDGAVTGWKTANVIDADAAERFGGCRIATSIFAAVKLLPTAVATATAVMLAMAWAAGAMSWSLVGALAVWCVYGVLAGRLLRNWLGRADLRRHYHQALTSPGYLLRTMRGRRAEQLVGWLRAGRVGNSKAKALMAAPLRFAMHLPLSILPAGLHRMLTDGGYARARLAGIFVRPVRLYFNVDARTQWLREMLDAGRAEGVLSAEDHDKIVGRLAEPYIQKYLQSLAVHICTLPITQVVSVIVAVWYVLAHPELSWEAAAAYAGAILVAFQVVPVSPGSLVRGLYVVYLSVRDRNVRDYNIALTLGFFKYIGYLAFPIQMAYRYPALARFMAAHWATGAARVVPVFGERGALLERAAFDAFYNWPLTLRRRMRPRNENRATQPRRWWPVLPAAMLAAAALLAIDRLWLASAGWTPRLRQISWAAIPAAMLAGALVGGAAGSFRPKWRLILAALAGTLTAAIYAPVHEIAKGVPVDLLGLAASFVRRAFFLSVFAVAGAVIEEISVFKSPLSESHVTGEASG